MALMLVELGKVDGRFEVKLAFRLVDCLMRHNAEDRMSQV